jgi:cytochrome P450
VSSSIHEETWRGPSHSLCSNTIRNFSVTADKNSKKLNDSEDASSGTVEFQEIPQLPGVGSMVPWWSDIPAVNLKRIYNFFPAVREKYGTFYSMGFPGIGDGANGHVIVLGDPNEMLKVIRHESAYPSGFIQQEWATVKWLKNAHSPIVEGKDDGFFGSGETWKRLRTFLQTDLLSPVAAKGYVPGMIKAAQLASQGAPHSPDTMKDYVQRCSLDLFSTVMFGELIDFANPKSAAHQNTEHNVNAAFCDAVENMLSDETVQMMMNPYQILMNKMLGSTTSQFKAFAAHGNVARDIARQKILSFLERKKRGELSEVEEASYLALAMDRQSQSGATVSVDEMVDLSMVLMVAAVDTTSSLLHWVLVHLALNPSVQKTLHEELSKQVGEEGVVTADMLNKKHTPYLHAVLRENHRLTPAIFVTLAKKNATSDLEIHGKTFPKGTMFLLDAYSTGIKSDIVDDCLSFEPERWSDEAVEARTGTPSEVLDHPLLRDPFSHGARKCPGSRAANYEVLSMISQLVLDWDIAIQDPYIKSLQDVEYEQTATIHPTNIKQFHFTPRGK